VPTSAAKPGRKLKPDHELSKSALKLRIIKKLRCTLKFEKALWAAGATLIAGVDEVGRGALFGPVVAAAVILDPSFRIRGLRDSKLLEPEVREHLAPKIREHAIAWAIASVDSLRIDEINIYHASRQALAEAVSALATAPGHVLVDGNMKIEAACPQTTIVHGDARCVSIAAASILAKVERDRMMRELDPQYPVYGLASNKGYSTPRHKAVLREHGPSPLHRRSFAPVWMCQEEFPFMEAEAAIAGETDPDAVEAADLAAEVELEAAGISEATASV
jgi:ribonuclease HII